MLTTNGKLVVLPTHTKLLENKLHAFQKVLFHKGQREVNAMLTKQKPLRKLLGTIVADHDK